MLSNALSLTPKSIVIAGQLSEATGPWLILSVPATGSTASMVPLALCALAVWLAAGPVAGLAGAALSAVAGGVLDDVALSVFVGDCLSQADNTVSASTASAEAIRVIIFPVSLSICFAKTTPWRGDSMLDEEVEAMRLRLAELRLEHRDLDEIIARLVQSRDVDQLQLVRLKKRKLMVKDTIARIESRLIPDLNA